MSRVSNRVAVGGVLVASALALLVATLPAVDADKAYLWVDTDGGTCEVNDPPATYVDADACADFESAYSAASPGWTVRVKAGTYPPQVVGDNAKFAPVKFLAEDGTTVDSTTLHNQGLALNGMVTVDNVNVAGDTPFVFLGGQRSTWQNSTFEEGAEGMNARSCEHNDAEPVLIYADDSSPQIRNAALRNVTIEEQHHRPAVDDTCAGGDLYHLELLRIDQNVDGVLLDSVFFSGCADCGSGLMFITTPSTAVPGPKNLVVRNSIFESSSAYSFQMQANVDECENYVFAYNTFAQDNNVTCDSDSSTVKWIGNLGPRPIPSPCKDMQFIKNVWQAEFHGFDFHCGTDTIVYGTEYGIDQLGLTAAWKLEAGSPAIDAAETPSDRDYCTGPLAGDDFDGDPRPVGAACDAGSDEWQG